MISPQKRVKPFSPQEAAEAYSTEIPDEIIAAVNFLLAGRGSHLSFTRSELVAKAEELFKLSGDVPAMNLWHEKRWFNFENLYRAQGWKIEYDSPSYADTWFDSYWVFKAAK